MSALILMAMTIEVVASHKWAVQDFGKSSVKPVSLVVPISLSRDQCALNAIMFAVHSIIAKNNTLTKHIYYNTWIKYL